MQIGILLSGCGVYDGAEIQEAVLSMLAIQEAGHTYQCIGINANQHHVVNHLTGAEMPESRNMLTEAARIARGSITEIQEVKVTDFDALLIPGGFGSAKNLTSWAFDGPQGSILPSVKKLILEFHAAGLPIVALCVSPVVLAKAFEKSETKLQLTLGTDSEPTPYDINDMNAGLVATGAEAIKKTIREIQIDSHNKIISAPCYMMETDIASIYRNVKQTIAALQEL